MYRGGVNVGYILEGTGAPEQADARTLRTGAAGMVLEAHEAELARFGRDPDREDRRLARQGGGRCPARTWLCLGATRQQPPQMCSGTFENLRSWGRDPLE